MSLIEADMHSLTAWERVRLWLRRLFHAGNQVDAFVEFRVAQIRDRIRQKADDLIDTEHRAFEGVFASRVRPLVSAAMGVGPFFQHIWKDANSLRGMLDTLLARRVPGAKASLTQFVPMRELQEVFRTTESRRQLKQLVLDRVAEYIDSVPDSVFDEISVGLTPLYALKEVALFDYDALYVAFGSSVRDVLMPGDIDFHTAQFHKALEPIEGLYLALYNARRAIDEFVIYDEVLEHYLAERDGHKTGPGANEPTDADDEASGLAAPEANPDDVASLRARVNTLQKAAAALRESVPLPDIIRFVRSDPYYRFIAYVPKLRLRDFYYSSLKIKALEELDARFKDLQMGVLGQLIQEVFPNGLVQMSAFHPEIPAAVRTAGVGQLNVYRSLQVIHTFGRAIYDKGLPDFLRLLSRLVPARVRQAGADFTLNLASLEDVFERLRAFDESFAPDSEEGKTFFRFRYSARDASQLAAFKALVGQKERDAAHIIEKFAEQLKALVGILRIVKPAINDTLNERYRTFVPDALGDRPLDKRFGYTLRAVEGTQKMLQQMVNIEREE